MFVILFNANMYPQDFLFIFHGFLCVLVYGSSISHTRRGLGAGVTQVADFECPEEFGYYPHPTDCTQYYVCVFGGALLESCTGGLMYSHELQTCDWPRNVGCGESNGSDGGTISTVRVTDPRTRNPQQSGRLSTSPQEGPAQALPTRSSHRQEYNRPHQEEVIQQQLYAEEDLGPAEEIESDRQQRVYRGQPSTIGQVQRDRDGLRPLKNSVHSQNVIPTGPGTQDKISVVSFGSQRPSAPRPQEQYRHLSTNTMLDRYTTTTNNKTDNITKTNSRTKRQMFARTGPIQYSAQIPFIFYSGADSQFNAGSFIPNPYGNINPLSRSPLVQAYNYNIQKDNKIHLVHPVYEYYQPQKVAAAVHLASRKPTQTEAFLNRSHTKDDLLRLTKSTIQTEFRPIRYSRPVRDQTVKPQNVNVQSTKYIESIINPFGAPTRILTKLPESTPKVVAKRPRPPNSSGQKLFSSGGLIRITTEKPQKNSTAYYHHSPDEYKNWFGPTKTINIKHNVNRPPGVRITTERYPNMRTSSKPNPYKYVEKPKDYDLRWYNLDSTAKGERNATSDVGVVQHHRYVQFVRPQEYEYESEYDEKEKKTELTKQNKEEEEMPTQNEKPLTDINVDEMRKKNMSFFDFIDELGFRDAEEVKAAIKTKMSTSTETTILVKNDEKFYVHENGVNVKRGWKRPFRYQTTTVRPRQSANQIEAPRKKIPEEYYENFKPSPTKSFYLTRQPDDDDNLQAGQSSGNSVDDKLRVEQVQAHHLTSALPPLTATARPVERYNTSQRFQPNQFDQYYTLYDDGVEIYKSNDYSHHFQSPSSTPSSNIANQYRGQTTYKQSLEEHAPEPVQQQQQQQQQHRNVYSQDLYSPPPVLQDFNDQYNIQIDEQHYQQLGQPTPKPSSRSESTNSSKDALTESSGISVTLVPENVTSKPDTAPIIRRSDSNSYFSISSFGPSTVLLPPLRFTSSTPKFIDTTFPPPKSEKPLFSDALPAFQNGRANFEPPKNGGALAKTFNSFDNLLSSFIAAVTKSNNRPTSSLSTTPPTPVPPKTSPETIVRSEIGRIHHDPVVITENFKIRQPTLRKPEVSDNSKLQIVPLPPPSSTPVPPKLSQNDYLAYFVEIEPKKPKKEEAARGVLLTTPQRIPETTTEPKIITKDNLGFGQSDQVGFNAGKNRPFNNFIRIVPTSQTQNVQLGTTLELEPIDKSQEKKKVLETLENDTIEKQQIIGPITTVSRQPFNPLGKWVIAKNERPPPPPPPQQPFRFSGTPKPNPFKVYAEEERREEPNYRGKTELEVIQKERAKEVEEVPNRGRGNLLQIHANPVPELETTVVSSPYKFLVVDVDSSTEQLSTPAPFSRNPENEERNRFSYKTNPESRVRPRYFDNSSSLVNEGKPQNPFAQEGPVQVSTETTTSYLDTDDRIRFSYKTNPESRFRNRFVGSSDTVIEDRKPEKEITPKIIVPDIKPEVKPVLVLEEKPIQVFSQEEREPDLVFPKRRKPEFRPKNVEIEPSKPPFRYRSTTESSEVKTASEEFRKPPRRVVKIHRNDLKNQRLPSTPKLKRIQKPSTKSPIVVLEDLEEKTLLKENEIHPISTYRPIVVTDGLDASKNKSRFRFSVEDDSDFTIVPDNKIGPFATEKLIIDTVPRGFEKPKIRLPTDSENDVPDREPSSEKPLYPVLKRPLALKNLTQFENRATTKGFRGKFKPSDSSKLRLRPTTASPDSETTPGPHLTTRQPGGYTIGNTGNEVTISRGTPSPNRGTRPTLKPSTAIVSKASEFIDIYRYPPRRPPNLYATPTPDKSAAKCRKDVCLLPDCSCGGKEIPGGYSAEEIPQLVLLTFDDSVNDLNKGLYAELFERGRTNPNGCPISATFYVSHEWTDYSQVQNLYANGHEIASHSITHSFGEQFSQKKWTKEIAGQREILAAYGGVRLEDIRGMRAPFLAVGGNKMFKMLYDSNFTYDSSMPIYENRPPSWPYTLDYKLFHDCMIPPCPTKSYPGVWEVPMVMWQDLNGGRCSMGDACSNPPTADGVYKMLIKNFERHFTTNRAPFGLYYHAAWFTHEHHKEGFIAFLDTIVNMPEVWLVTTWQAIEWMRDPQPLSTVNNFPPFQCNVEKARKCNNPKVCNLWHKSGVRYMRTCQPCPDVYPWTGKTGVKNSRVDNEIIDE